MSERVINRSFRWPEKIAPQKGALSFLGLILALITTTSVLASDANFAVQSASLQKEENVWFLQTTIDYQLSEAAVEALNNGVPLTITVQFKLKKTRPWLWRKTIFRKELTNDFSQRANASTSLPWPCQALSSHQQRSRTTISFRQLPGGY